MTKRGVTLSGSVLASFLVLGAMSSVASAADLSKYRMFQLGTDLATVARQADVSISRVKVIQRRPALIQEMEWLPQPLREPARELVFSFYNGELFRVAVNYDSYETEGLTVDDLIEAISAAYGTSARPAAPAKSLANSYGEEQEVLAQWQDPQYRFDLIRPAYGPSFKLTGVLKRLEALAEASVLEAKLLDDREAPQREAARISNEEEAARADLAKARLVNKPKFRP